MTSTGSASTTRLRLNEGTDTENGGDPQLEASATSAGRRQRGPGPQPTTVDAIPEADPSDQRLPAQRARPEDADLDRGRVRIGVVEPLTEGAHPEPIKARRAVLGSTRPACDRKPPSHCLVCAIAVLLAGFAGGLLPQAREKSRTPTSPPRTTSAAVPRAAATRHRGGDRHQRSPDRAAIYRPVGRRDHEVAPRSPPASPWATTVETLMYQVPTVLR